MPNAKLFSDVQIDPTLEMVPEINCRLDFHESCLPLDNRINHRTSSISPTPCPTPQEESLLISNDTSLLLQFSESVKQIATEVEEEVDINTSLVLNSPEFNVSVSQPEYNLDIFTPEKQIMEEEYYTPNFNEPQVTFQGWLKKQKPTGFMRTWKKRWCVFYDTGLFRYYSEAPGTNGKTEEKYRKGKGDAYFIDLKVTGQDGNTFWIGTTKRMWKFQASSDDEASVWLSKMTEPFKREKEQFERECEGAILEIDDVQFNKSNVLQQPPKVSTFYRAPSISRRSPPPSFNQIKFDTFEEQVLTPSMSYSGNLSPREYIRQSSCPTLFDNEEKYTMEIQQEGWLQKQASSFGYFNKRWCVLYKNGTFKYYNSPEKKQNTSEKKKNKRILDFSCIQASGINGREFWIETKERKWIFRAANFVLASEWLNAILSPEHLDSTLSLIPIEDTEKIAVWKLPTPEQTKSHQEFQSTSSKKLYQVQESSGDRVSVSYVS